jgi:LPS-assembly protein
MRRRFAAALAVALLAAAPARAQQPPAGEQPGLGESREPVVFAADEVQYDSALGLVVARGHVEIAQSGYTLLADTVTYNQHTDTITASGGVTLFQPTGEIMFAEFIELTNQMHDAFVRDVRMLMSDRSRLAANTGRRTGNNRTELRRGVYSPCELCREDPTRAPLWQLRAGQISYDQELHKIEYRDAVLEIAGIPVLYTPYLAHPDTKVKRQSGFLPPTFGSSSTLGPHIQIPYFWAIGPDKDLTVSPLFTTDAGIVGAGIYRQRFDNGELEVNGSITKSNLATSSDGSTPEQDDVRGHIFARGRFDLTDTYRTGFDLQRTTDQTYLRRYRFVTTENFLRSRAFLERFEPRSFADVNLYSFQPLRFGLDDAREPLVLPVASYDWVAEPDRFGGIWDFNGNLQNIFQDVGPDSQRLSLGTRWQLPFRGAVGDLFTLTTSLRGDAYHVADVNLGAGDPNFDGFTGRVFPQAALQWRYPWIRRAGTVSEIIEPIAAVIASPNGLNPPRIPNIDSLAFDFDETMLFDLNRFPGRDRVDSGQRVDYGLRAAVYGDGGGSTRLLVGQSYRLQENHAFLPGSGLDERLSDIVGRVVVSPGGYLDFVYRFRLDNTDFTPRRHEVVASAGPDSLRLSISYLDLPEDPASPSLGSREQITGTLTMALTRYWSATLFLTRNLAGDGETLSSGVSATYLDECLAFVAQIQQSGVRDRDIEPGVSVLFSIVFRNLGELLLPAFSSQ